MESLRKFIAKSESETVKGAGIALVVIGHISYPIFNIVHIYIYHMPLFFFIGGIGLGARTIKEQISSDFPKIMLYAVAMTAVYAVIGKIIFVVFGLEFIKFKNIGLEDFTTRIFTENSHHVLLFLVGWFLVALFFARSLAILLLRTAERLLPPGLASAALLLAAMALCYAGMVVLAGWFHATRSPWINLGAQVTVATGFILIGREALACRPLLRALRHPLTAALLATALYEAVVALGVQPMSMAWSEYPAGFWRHMLGAVLGILLILNIAFTVARLRPDSMLAVVGRHSKAVMSHHLFTFVLINLTLAGFGVVALQDIEIWYSYAPQVTWPFYAALGVGLPILFEQARRRAAAPLRTRLHALLRKDPAPQASQGD